MKPKNSGGTPDEPMDIIANRWHIKRVDRRTKDKVEPYYTILDTRHNVALGVFPTAKEARIEAMKIWELCEKNMFWELCEKNLWNNTANRLREQVHTNADACSDILRLGEALRMLRGE